MIFVSKSGAIQYDPSQAASQSTTMSSVNSLTSMFNAPPTTTTPVPVVPTLDYTHPAPTAGFVPVAGKQQTSQPVAQPSTVPTYSAAGQG